MRKWKRDLLRLRQKIKQERNRINMTSQTLREARKYEEASEKMIKQEERPDFHLSVRTGWMNDPNGFSYYNGQYHLFYQYRLTTGTAAFPGAR